MQLRNLHPEQVTAAFSGYCLKIRVSHEFPKRQMLRLAFLKSGAWPRGKRASEREKGKWKGSKRHTQTHSRSLSRSLSSELRIPFISSSSSSAPASENENRWRRRGRSQESAHTARTSCPPPPTEIDRHRVELSIKGRRARSVSLHS